MNAPSIDIAKLLELEVALDLQFADNLFVAKEPTQPDNCITIYDTTNKGVRLGLNDISNYYYCAFQVRIRNNHYTNGWAIANDIVTLLHGRANITVDGSIYKIITCVNGPVPLQWDEKNRAIIVINFNLQRKGE